MSELDTEINRLEKERKRIILEDFVKRLMERVDDNGRTVQTNFGPTTEIVSIAHIRILADEVIDDLCKN